MKSIREAKWFYIICSVLTAAAGIYIIIRPHSSAIFLCRLMGVLAVICGAAKIFGYISYDIYNLAFQFDLSLGIFAIIAGLVMLLRSEHVIAFLPVLIGIFILVDGVFKLQTAVDAYRFGLSGWWLFLIGSVICAILGILLITDPFYGSEALTVLVGIGIAADGIQNLFNAAYTVKIIKNKKL